MSIRRKLTIMFLAIALIPLLFVSYLTYTNYKKSLETNRFSQLQDLTVFRADRIETYFAGLKSHIEMAQAFYNIKKNLPILTRFANDPNNPEFLAAKKMLDEQLQQMESVSGLSDIMLINPEGRVVYTSNNPVHFGKDMTNGNDAEQKVFSRAKDGVYFSDVYFDKAEDNRYEILLTAPAIDFNGDFIGVIAFEVDMTSVYKLIQDTTGLGQTGEVLVARKIGNQIEYLNPLRHEPNTIMKRINTGEKIGGPIQEAVQGKTGTGQLIDYRGKKVIAAWRYIPSLEWGLVAKIDTEEAFADVTNLRNLSMVILVIIFVLSGIVAFSIARSISEPIKRLSEGAEIVGRGNLNYKIGTNLEDEIGQLSRAFDKMTQDLKLTTASRDELNIEIDERKQVEEALRKNEIKYRTVADNTYDWEFWLDPEDRFIYCSPSCERITGHKPEEFFADPGLRISLIHPDDLAKFEKHIQEVEHKQAGATETEWRYVRPNGTFCWVAHICLPVYDDHGQFIGTRGSNRDITERKQTEDALKFLVECGSPASGEDFFQSLARYLGQALGMDFVCIDRLEENLLAAKTVAVYFDGKFEDNISYTLKDTPCGDVVGKTICCFSKDVRHLFPKDKVLQDMAAESYVGTTLWSSKGQPIGLIAIIGRKPLADAKLATSILQLAAVRAAGELERGQAEEAVKVSEVRYRRLFEAARDGILILDSDSGQLVDVNPFIKEMLGYSHEELLGKKIWEIGLFKNIVASKESFLELQTKGFVRYENMPLETKAGRHISVEFVSNVYLVDHKKVIQCNIHDITDRVKAEEALRQAHDQLELRVQERTKDLTAEIAERKKAQEALRSASLYSRGLLEASLDPLVTISPEGKITDVNKATELVTGLSRESLIGSDFSNYFTEPKKAEEVYQKVLSESEGQAKNYPLSIRHKSGRITDVLYNATVYKNEAGEVQGVFTTARDITEKKLTEAELEKYRLHLEDLVKQRTEELARSNSDLEQFAYVASHDLREPLRSITGFLDLLQMRYKDKLDENGREFIDFAVSGANRMSDLLIGLLEYSRVQSGGKPKASISAQAALDDALANLKAVITETNAAITYDKLPTILADNRQITQLLQNLIHNGLKFRGEQRPQIHIGCRKEKKSWVFSVHDNGIGIDPQYYERIFMIFQRLHPQGKYPGSGIGLAVCKKIVERHDGRIWVESDEGKGSTFYFSIPE